MSAVHVLPLLLIGLWIALLSVFAWVHRPEPAITEIIRALESRS